ncbi:MAG: SMC-Scp complex subunit ScpB [Candidatus Puniceispirillaceae bacterium]
MSDSVTQTGQTFPEALLQKSKLIEALIFASPQPLRDRDIISHLSDETELAPVIAIIEERYGAFSGVELVRRGDAFAFRTRPEVAEALNIETQVERPLSRAAMEVLAIIAYHQPVTRAEIEEIRGISLSKGTMDILLEMGWIKPRGRRRTPGRPLTWGTSPAFLDHFSLDSIDSLPGMDELKSAGLLRKGIVLGGLGENNEDNVKGGDEDLLESAFDDAAFDDAAFDDSEFADGEFADLEGGGD